MLVLEINNSFSQLKNLTPAIYVKLRKLLSYTTDPKAAYFAGGYGSRPKYLIDAKGTFPTGLIYTVIGFLLDNAIKFEHLDNRKIPRSIPNLFKLELGDIVPYEDQLKAAATAVAAGRGGIIAPTGTGKSLIIALIAARLNVKTLVVVPSLEIKQQLTDSLAECLTGAGHITIENIDSKRLKTIKGFDCLIIDECHHTAAKTYQNLNKTAWKDIYYRFFLTATYFRNATNEQLLFEAIAGEPVYEITYKQAIKKGYIVPVEAYYAELPKTKVDGYTWAQVYKELVVNNDYRNGVIAGMLEGLELQRIPTLCLVKEIAHGEILSKLTGVPFANGQDEESRDFIRQFNSGGLMALIGTTGILGEGVDTKPAEYVIIAGLGKAKSAFMQQVGRGVRRYQGKKSCKVVIFKDNSHKWTKSHFKAQLDILFDEYGVAPAKL